MLRWSAFFVGVCLSASGVARADTPQTSSLTSEQAAKFTTFFEMAERARAAGRVNEAAILYEEALKIQPHPVVAGRLGLILAKLGQVDKAAQVLHEAVARGQGASAAERREVLAAYDKARVATTWVNVNISVSGAQVTYDGKPSNREGFSSFWQFVMPGEHVLRATLDGYEDAVQTFTAKAGEEMTVSLTLVPKVVPKLLELPATEEKLLRKKTRDFPPLLSSSNIATDPNYAPNEDPSYGEPKEPKPAKKKDGPRFSISGGVVTVFGVASWNPAVGGVVGVAVRANDYFSLGLEGRAAWLTTGVANRPISSTTAGGIVSACGHFRWFFGCGIGHLGAINVQLDPAGYKAASLTYFKPGAGGRIGARVEIGKTFSLQGAVDTLWFSRGTRVVVEQVTIVDQPAIMVGTEILGGWEF